MLHIVELKAWSSNSNLLQNHLQKHISSTLFTLPLTLFIHKTICITINSMPQIK
ncbi:hypothetical protein HanXRQr2_Chr08g0326331 [Helianthus annuus]|uniref:Uncharacterized protein n=1 Tax=Helianthus annuus TaxID=4232 RepID=A0A9K3ICI2_HELAN|nr:hypothetical protein HanXRQr2_Chr08g0326331 [Helianthus annuus]